MIEDIRNYKYLTHGNVTVAGQDDKELFRQLVEAMDIMGFTKEEIASKDLLEIFPCEILVIETLERR